MTKIRHVDFYADEWLVGTMGLGVVDVGVYIQACALIYSRGGPIEKDDLRRFVVCHGNMFEAALRHLADAGKLIVSGSQISSNRCETTLETTRKRIRSWSENGQKGGRPRKENNDLPKPNGSYARVREPKPKEDYLEEKGEGLGRCAPSEVPVAEDNEPPAPPVIEPADTEPVGQVDALVASAVAHLEGKRTRVVDPVAYERGIEAAKWQNWLASLHPLIGKHLSGAALWPAYEAISAAQTAGSREATPRQVRDVLNHLAKLRPTETRAAA